MARHVYDRMMEEDEMQYGGESQYDDEALYGDKPEESSEARRERNARRQARWNENAEKFREGTKEVKEAFKKNYNKKQKILLVFHRLWRVINWLIIIWLANQAFSKILSLLQVSRAGRPKLVCFMVSIGIAAYMVLLGEGTDHDKDRRKGGQIIAIASECIMLLKLLIDTVLIMGMDLVNAVTSKIGGGIFNVQNYKNSDLGLLWVVNLGLAIFVCVSLRWEEQSTDNRLGFARTPQKKEITDFGETKDEEGNVIWRFKKYKQ